MNDSQNAPLESLIKEIQSSHAELIQYVIEISKENYSDAQFPKDLEEMTYFSPEPDHPGRSTPVTRTRERKSFSKFYREINNQIEESEQQRSLDQLCNKFRTEHSTGMESIYGQLRLGFRMLHLYFEKAGKFEYDLEVAKSIVDTFITNLTSKTETIELVYHVDHFEAESSFNLSHGLVSFSEISEEDLWEFSKSANGMPISRLRQYSFNSKDWICRICIQANKGAHESFNNSERWLDTLIGALGLTIENGRAAFTLLSKSIRDPFLGVGTISSGNAKFSGRGLPLKLTNENIAELKSNFKEIQEIFDEARMKPLRLAIRRHLAFATRTNNSDAFLDLVIAIESLLATDSPALETTYRFKLRGAAILPVDFGNARERLDLMNRLYSLRSRIVHGSADDQSIADLTQTLEKVFKQILKTYLRLSHQIEPIDIVKRIDEHIVDGYAGSPLVTNN